ncbi:nitroreductase family protein [uncultured Parolsenella sp.]|uniref:nitroreductase family protein n=1 Tax=uncultured Parolsenella sp. TaxID=2083008 RepID=UPI0027D98757|nr:nitroreductase family protein [uncultured Parolsenella sp.]
MNDVVKSLEERRSCRKYDGRQVEPEKLEEIVEAGLWAASGMGQQATHLILVQDPETIATLSRMNAQIMGSSGDPFYGAPTVVVVLADATRPTCVEDGALVMGNLMVAAHSLGVASCWIHRAHEEFETAEGKALLAKWGVEGDWRGVGHCLLGYAAEGGEKPGAARKAGRVTYVR